MRLRAVVCIVGGFIVGCGHTYYGRYTIDSIPSGAHIIGPQDADWGATPTRQLLTSPEIGCKKYEIRVVHEDYEDKVVELEGCTQDKTIEGADLRASDHPEQRKKYELQRRLIRSAVEIVSTPAGATVYLENNSLGQTPLSDVKLTWANPDDTKELRFELPGYQTATHSLSPRQKRVDAVLQPTKAGER